LAIETFASRATSSSGSPPKSRGTIPILPLTEKRLGLFPSTPEGTPTPVLGERSGAPSDLRPSSFFMGNTPVEVQFTSAGCLNYPCRTPKDLQIGYRIGERVAKPGLNPVWRKHMKFF